MKYFIKTIAILFIYTSLAVCFNCYIDEENQLDIQFDQFDGQNDGEFVEYESLQNVLYLNNTIASFEKGPNFLSESSNYLFFSFSMKNWLLQNQTTDIFTYTDEDNQFQLTFQANFDNSLTLKIQDGEEEDIYTQQQDILPYTWYSIILRSDNGYLSLKVNGNLIFEVDKDYNLVSSGKYNSYEFGDKSNFSGYFFDYKIIQDYVLEDFHLYCLQQKQCDNESVWNRGDIAFGWFNNQCKKHLCTEQNQLLNSYASSDDKLSFSTQADYFFDKQYLDLRFKPNKYLDNTCIDIELLQINKPNFNQPIRQPIIGNYNEFSLRQDLNSLQNYCFKITNYNQELVFNCEYQIKLSFVGASFSTFTIPVKFTYPSVAPEIKLQGYEQQTDFTRYNSYNYNSDIYANFDNFDQGVLYLMTSGKFNHRLPENFKFPLSYNGKFYVQWQMDREFIIKQLYLMKAALYDSKGQQFYNLNFEYSQTSNQNEQNIILYCQFCSSGINMEKASFIRLKFNYRIGYDNREDVLKAAQNPKKEYTMDIPLQIQENLILQ